MTRDEYSDRWWADQLEKETGFWWRVLRVGPHVTAVYRGYWDNGGVYHTGDGHDPEPLWAQIRDTQTQSRRWAIAAGVRPIPPVLTERLPDTLWVGAE